MNNSNGGGAGTGKTASCGHEVNSAGNCGDLMCGNYGKK